MSWKVHYEGDSTLNEEFEVHILQPADYKSTSTELLLTSEIIEDQSLVSSDGSLAGVIDT